MRTLSAVVLCIAATFAQAQGYPSQPVKILVGFPPGGTTDVMGRLTAQELAVQTGKPFLVENRPGASGSLALRQPALHRCRARARGPDRQHAVRVRGASVDPGHDLQRAHPPAQAES